MRIHTRILRTTIGSALVGTRLHAINAAVWHDDDMTGRALSASRTALAGLMAVSLAGSADVGEFLTTRTTMFIDAPGRAAGSVLGLLFWLALLGIAAARYFGRETRWSSAATVGLAAFVAVGNVGLGLIHLKAGIGGWRPMMGGALGVAALLAAGASVACIVAVSLAVLAVPDVRNLSRR